MLVIFINIKTPFLLFLIPHKKKQHNTKLFFNVYLHFKLTFFDNFKICIWYYFKEFEEALMNFWGEFCFFLNFCIFEHKWQSKSFANNYLNVYLLALPFKDQFQTLDYISKQLPFNPPLAIYGNNILFFFLWCLTA